jgi:histidine ammonia-lyase
LLRLLEGSEIRASHVSCRRVQDAYSLRCAPQVHGAVRDTLSEARRVFSIELNSATDNPLVLDGDVLSGGNFHGEPLALQLDYLAIALAALSGISERRIDRLVNPALNEDLPPFLARHPGLESGLMMAQVTAAALVAENRVLATPASPGSITTSGNKEDFVSMGMTSAMKWKRVVRNTRSVLAIEALASTRALEFLQPLKTSPRLEIGRQRIRSACAAFEGDRPISPDIAALETLIASGELTVACHAVGSSHSHQSRIPVPVAQVHARVWRGPAAFSANPAKERDEKSSRVVVIDRASSSPTCRAAVKAILSRLPIPHSRNVLPVPFRGKTHHP